MHRVSREHVPAVSLERIGTWAEGHPRQRARAPQKPQVVIDGLIERLWRGARLALQHEGALLRGPRDHLVRLEVMLEGRILTDDLEELGPPLAHMRCLRIDDGETCTWCQGVAKSRHHTLRLHPVKARAESDQSIWTRERCV